MWEYLAGVFDVRGHLHIKTEKDEKGRTRFNVFFYFTDNDKEVFYEIHNFLNEQGIKNSIYFIRKKSNLNEYQLYITNRKDVVRFLERIYPYSLKKDLLNYAFEKYNMLKA